MKPKKVILLVSNNDIDISILSYVLNVHGYRVLPALSYEEAVSIFTNHKIRLPDLVIADWMGGKGNDLVNRLKQIANFVPMILMGDVKTFKGIHLADAMLDKKTTLNSELLERIRVMAARKRGPKKGTVPACVLQKKAEATAALQEVTA